MSKVSKIYQIHLRAVMLCMSKMYIKGVLRYINTRDQSNVESKIDQLHLRAGYVCRRRRRCTLKGC